jgi:hypothetical protein
MRYNGGGLLYIASELAYMVAGPATAGKTFERLSTTARLHPDAPIPFLSTAYGFPAPNPGHAPAMALPYLGLKRVTVLTTAGTCSASEAVINGLRGVDVEVEHHRRPDLRQALRLHPGRQLRHDLFLDRVPGREREGLRRLRRTALRRPAWCPTTCPRARRPGRERLLAAALAYRSHQLARLEPPEPGQRGADAAGAAGGEGDCGPAEADSRTIDSGTSSLRRQGPKFSACPPARE